jgi:amino acid adenylation domain-containing protein
MLEDAQITVLLTQAKLVEDGGWRLEDGDPGFLRLRSGQASILDSRLYVVQLDRDLPMIEQQSSKNPTTKIDSHNLAYVIYTSGSTGTPKGVAIEHRNTVALLNWAKDVFTSDELAGVLASTSICFDLFVFELFVPLSWGGKILLVENTLSLREVSTKGITLVNTVPSAMAALLAAGALRESVRVVNLAGEPLRPELVNQLYQTGTVENVYDLYGPSETTTYSTFTRRTANGPATIGRPITNTYIYLLDSRMQPVPIGVPGELYIGGAGVARGYLHRPELTAEKFLSDPFSGGASSRVYCTGDLARYLPDGNIEFLGRIDNQVKLRGFRIELGEIEATLNRHPAVKEAVVDAYQADESMERQLVGYIVLDKALASDPNDVRAYLESKLPVFMIPNVLMTLAALPMTSSGKLDRSKLPSPEASCRDLDAAPIPPRSESEELIANIWRDVLQIEDVSVNDNFFALGGHSLSAIQIVSRLQESVNKEVPLRILFDNPTVAALRETIETIIRGGQAPELPPIVRVPRDRPLPLSMNQEHLWYLDRILPGTHFFNMPYVYQLSGKLNVEALQKALSEIIRRHEALRTVFKEIDGRPAQVIKDGSDIQLAVIDLRSESLDESSEKASGLMLEERQNPIDLTTGPLLRAKLIRLTDIESFLLLTLHHIISDHGSMQILQRELLSVYGSITAGVPLRLPEPSIQFADYAVWEGQMLAAGLLRSQLDYWLEKLALPKSQLDIPARPDEEHEHLVQRSVEKIDLDPTQFGRLRNLARITHCTPFMIISAALGIFLYRLSGHGDIRIGTLISNRRQKNTEFAIGYFLNTIVLCLRIDSHMTFGQCLKMAREATLVASSHQELPFEYLARKLETLHVTSRESLFRVLIIYNQSYRRTFISGLTLDSFIVDRINVQGPLTLTGFDMIINLYEAAANLSGSITFNPQTFEPSVISSLKAFLTTVIDKMMNEPNQTISLVE